MKQAFVLIFRLYFLYQNSRGHLGGPQVDLCVCLQYERSPTWSWTESGLFGVRVRCAEIREIECFLRSRPGTQAAPLPHCSSGWLGWGSTSPAGTQTCFVLAHSFWQLAASGSPVHSPEEILSHLSHFSLFLPLT